jgi:hypothetical protein
MNRQKLILFILLVVLVLSVLYAWMATPQQQTVAPGASTASSRGEQPVRSGDRSAVDLQKVNLDLLEVDKKKYTGYRRDIFNFYTPKPKPTPPPVVKTPPKPVEPPPKPEPVVTPQIRKQLARFTFLGFLIKDEARTVFLSNRDELFLVRKEDSFGEESQFEVIDITEKKLTIRQAGASGQIEIVLVEEEPLIPSISIGEDSGSASTSVNRESSPAKTPGATVPPEERRRKWFKKTQPTQTETN